MTLFHNRLVRTALGAALVGTTVAAFASAALATAAFAAPAASPSPAADPTTPTTVVATGGKTLAQIQADGAAAIAQREAQLTKLGAELATAPSCDVNGVVATEISTDEPALTALGQKLAADTTIAEAKVDFGAIFTSYRVYLVVTPQAYVTAACGHIENATTRLTADEQKLATLVAALPDGPKKTAAEASLADMTTQLGNATTQANTAASGLAGIVPDKGNAAVRAANAAAVLTAHSHLTTSRTDLLTAVNDAKAVVADLTSTGV